MSNFRDSIKLFRFNIVNVILFEVILKTVSFAVLIPLYYSFINLAVNISGINYLTKETVGKFFKAPSTYGFMVIMLLFISLYIIIDISGISYAYHRANYLKKTSVFVMLLYGVKTAVRCLRPRNLPMVPFVLCYFPVITNVVFGFGLLNIHVPYIIDLVSMNTYVTIAVLVLYALLSLYTLRFTFVFHVFNVEKISFRAAIDRSKELLKGKRVRIIGGLLLWLILFVGIPLVVYYFYTGPFLNLVLTSKDAHKVLTMIYEAVKIVLSVIYILVGLPIICSYICNHYYNVIPEDDKPNLDDYSEYDAKKSRSKETKLFVVIVCLAIIANIAFYMLKRYNVISLNVEYLDKVTITAHRGDSSSAPENTLSAFSKALENGADIIELDVRQTKDGEIVVMHDESLRRTCGVDKKVGKLTLEKLKTYNANASYKGSDKELYENEKIPTLREALDLIGDEAKVNIELKPARTDKNLEEEVVKIIEEYDYYNNCVVASLSYGSIKKVKKFDPEIETVYVMAVAMGDFYNLEYVDGFSIKSRYITNDVVKNIHKNKKYVYAWTIDDSAILENMMLMDVDSIITNKPAEMRRAMYENYYGDTLIERINNYLENEI